MGVGRSTEKQVNINCINTRLSAGKRKGGEVRGGTGGGALGVRAGAWARWGSDPCSAPDTQCEDEDDTPSSSNTASAGSS